MLKMHAKMQKKYKNLFFEQKKAQKKRNLYFGLTQELVKSCKPHGPDQLPIVNLTIPFKSFSNPTNHNSESWLAFKSFSSSTNHVWYFERHLGSGKRNLDLIEQGNQIIFNSLETLEIKKGDLSLLFNSLNLSR